MQSWVVKRGLGASVDAELKNHQLSSIHEKEDETKMKMHCRLLLSAAARGNKKRTSFSDDNTDWRTHSEHTTVSDAQQRLGYFSSAPAAVTRTK